MQNKTRIRRNLLAWYAREKRSLPWRESGNPYHIWVSEIMLQQTRVAAVLGYYRRFLERFPDIESLAAAGDQELLACWSGLGYYSRARNLRRAAQLIVAAGAFPEDHAEIRKLPGIGDYTAAAVASIAFGKPHAVLDGNVMRVLSRLNADDGDLGSGAVRKRLQADADDLLDRRYPGDFNQAVMELGATVCLPREPQCLLCPIAEDCDARNLGLQDELPKKTKRTQPVYIEKILLILERNGSLLLWQRPETDRRMPGFWELPETDHLPAAQTTENIWEFRHTITHHHYRVAVRKASAGRIPKGFEWVKKSSLCELPLSTATKKALAGLNIL